MRGVAITGFGVVSALYHRQRTGVGQKLETSLFSTGLALQAQNVVHIDRLDERQHAAELELLRSARQQGKNHTAVVDEFAQMRLREDMPDTTTPRIADLLRTLIRRGATATHGVRGGRAVAGSVTALRRLDDWTLVAFNPRYPSPSDDNR